MAQANQHANGNENAKDQDSEQLEPPADNGAPLDSEELAGMETKTEQPKVARKPIPITITDVELEQLKKEASEYKDKYLRVLAESENTRKRLQKERQELIQYALQNLTVEFLHPIDHMENALKYTQQMSDEVKHWALGFQMILTQFKDVLARNGVTPFTSEGKPFDPHCHEAVETTCTDEHPPGTVVEESLRGYKMNDRIIRPARVKVSKASNGIKENLENKKE